MRNEESGRFGTLPFSWRGTGAGLQGRGVKLRKKGKGHRGGEFIVRKESER
jgi:hypothetical protein